MPQSDISDFISKFGNNDPSPSGFIFCSNHNCSSPETVNLSKSQWNEAKRMFQPPPKNGQEERARISLAIGALETVVGRITGTEKDKLGSVRGWVLRNRFDCVDNAANTGSYLYMLRKEGLLRFHEVLEPARRGFLIDGRWPHIAVLIMERNTGRAYVVDSSFLDNGNPAYVVPYEDWIEGWKPQSPAVRGLHNAQ